MSSYTSSSNQDKGDANGQQRYERNNNSNGGYNSNGQRPDNNNGRNNRRRDNWRNYRDINKSSPQKKLPDASLDNSPKHSNSSLDGEPIGVVSPRSLELSLDSQKCSQRDKLIREIEARKLECLVCVEPIKGHHSVWFCSNCYHILHLVCTTKWASSSQSNDGWRCPACQNVTKTIPREYYCFCGKLKNPPYNRSDVAHSCGETCGRKDACPHPCTLLCHPGPCPPCQVMVQRECGCGRTKKSMQCCIREDIECDNKCEKLLNCELHEFDKGKCPSCKHKVDQQCYCSKVNRQVACTRESNEKKQFSCGKPLACGNHKFKDNCHSGDCKPCKLTPDVVTSCPCGKMMIKRDKRKSCLDLVATCTGVCGRILKCGPPAAPHHCTSQCHSGNCPPCSKQTAVCCRCRNMDEMIKCRQLVT